MSSIDETVMNHFLRQKEPIDASEIPIKSVQHWKYSAAFEFIGRKSNIYLTNVGF